MMVNWKEKVAEVRKNGARTWMLSLTEFSLGFVFAAVTVDGSFAPFGPAYAAVCGFPGLLGALMGQMTVGADVLRGLTACCLAYFGRRILPRYFEAERHAGRFLLVLWAMIAAALVGAFFGTYTFRENALFALSGVFGGFFGYLFSVCRDGLLRTGGMPSSRLCFFAFGAAGAVLFAGGFAGGFWRYPALALAVFALGGLAVRCSVFYVCTFAMLPAFAVCLYGTDYVWAAVLLCIGTLAGSLLSGLGDFAPPAGFLLATVMAGIFYGDSMPLWQTFAAVCAGGLLQILLPRTTADRIFRFFVPEPKPSTRLKRRKKVSETGRRKLEGAAEFGRAGDVCGLCANRYLCWVRDYTETRQRFERLRKGGDGQAERELHARCEKSDEILVSLRADEAEETAGFSVSFAKVFRNKRGEIVCGDTSGTFCTEDGKFVLCIADGMGSGTGAARQSEQAERMMERLLKNGVKREDALEFLNRSVGEEAGEKILGLDMAVVDLCDGACELYKADAAPTFVIRRGTVYAVGSASLPMGAGEAYSVRRHDLRLADGDFLVMISDGLCGDGSKRTEETVSRLCSEGNTDCFSLADGVLRSASGTDGLCDDDVTVIAAKITRAGT